MVTEAIIKHQEKDIVLQPERKWGRKSQAGHKDTG